MANTIKIPGELESVATGNKVVDVANVKDKTKGNKSQFQINAEHEAALSDRYTKEETYNKEEVEQMVTPPSPDYKYYATYAEMIAETSHPAGAIYRVSSYDGTQVDATSYTEYTWNGSEYKILDVKSQVNEVFDITVYNSNTKYADLTAALGVDGANVPEGVRRGGMSIKFVQSSDNNYLQFRLMADSFSTNISDWQGVDDEPIIESKNLVKSGGVKSQLNQTILDSILFQEIPMSLYTINRKGLKSDGTLGDLSTTNTTDYIEIDSTKKYIHAQAFPSGYQWCFFILFDENKDIIETFYGDNLICIDDYSTAKYFRTSRTATKFGTSISKPIKELNIEIENNTDALSIIQPQVEQQENTLFGEETQQTSELPFSEYTYINQGLQRDGTLSALGNFNTTEYLSLEGVVGLSGTMFQSGYNWCFLILFDESYNIVDRFYGETDIDLSDYPNAKYFRATRNADRFALNLTKNVREGGLVQNVEQLMPVDDVIEINTSIYGIINDGTSTVVSGSQSDLIVSNENSFIEKDGYLKNITVESSGVGYMRFVVGSIDQRGWIIASKGFTLAVVNGVNIIEVSDKQIYLGQNEQLFVYANYDGNAKAVYVTNSSNVAIKGEYGSEVEKISTQNNLSIQLQYSVSEITSVFAEKRELEQVREMVHDNSVAIANSNFVEDEQGKKYRIIVVNGALVPEIVSFGKVAVLGNSLTCSFGENYPMAATTINTGWVKEIESLMLEVDANTNIHTINIARWERDFTYDLDDFNIPTDADTIIYKAGENVNNNPDKYNYLSALEALLTYVEIRCPNAKIYVCGGFWAGNTTTTMAARALGLQHINSGDEGNYRMSVGDYVYGEENVLHPITDAAVAWHVGDYGFYLWTNRLANALGLSQLDSVHIIDIASDSRKIFITRNIGVAGGIISIHTFSDTAPTFLISTDSETIQYTNNDVSALNIMRDGVKTTYVTTFVMPNKDVQIIRV